MVRDVFHEAAKQAFQKDGWVITHDPLPLLDKSRNIDYEIDLGAEPLIGAERGHEKIAIEVKSFLRASFTHEFHGVLGQYLVYVEALRQYDPDRKLHLAIPAFAAERMRDFPFIIDLITLYNIRIIVFDEAQHIISSWKP